jgi:hypothetical protein
MPPSSLENFHCVFCGHHFYEQKAFERHQMTEHDALERNEDGYLGDRESEGNDEDEDERTRGKKSHHHYLDVMFPTP